ncbi:MAG: TIGR02281 family clan AA aspartic protease [Formivibrio sp.]|nr:TIGR02281 family clan AA aspartic protease [Formivibrio sp.]
MRLTLATLLLLTSLCAQATELNLVAIMGDKAMVEIDGSKPKLLASGQSANGAKLLSVGGGTAVFDVGGQKKTLSMDSRSFKSSGVAAGEEGNGKQIILFAEQGGHFFANITINGMPFRGMIDTGATMLSLSNTSARQANIDAKNASKAYSSTANGVVPVSITTVNEIKFSNVVLYNVQAAISEGGSPQEPLIGMSILSRFKMDRDGDRLILTKRY